MANRKVKKKSLTSFSQSPRQPPPNDKVELEPSSSSSRQPPLPFSLPPPLALDSQPTVKTNPSSISGKAPVAHVGVHVGVGLSARKHKSGSATKTVEDIPPERLASDEDMEEEESSSCGSDSCSDDSSDLGEDDDSVSPPSAANGAPSPSSPSALVGDSGPAERPSAPIARIRRGKELSWDDVFSILHQNVNETNIFVDNKSKIVVENYRHEMVAKYGPHRDIHPSFDETAWCEA